MGGIAGGGSCSIDSSYNLGNIGLDTIGVSIGGIAGDGEVQINHSYNKGTIRGNLAVGGIAGGDGQILMSYNEGPVYGGDLAGGICGSGCKIVASYNSAPVVGEEDVGGLSGSSGDIEFSYNLGTVTGKSFVGGLAGDYRKGHMQYSYNIGKVTGDSIVGGLAGELAYYAYIDDAYNFGSVNALKNAGNCILEHSINSNYEKMYSVFYNGDSCFAGSYWAGNKDQQQVTEAFKNKTVTDLLNQYRAYWMQGDAYPVLYPYERILEIRSGYIKSPISEAIPAATFNVRTEGRILYIDGLTEGTSVSVFNVAGKLEMKATAERYGIKYQVKQPGVYILRIGNSPAKQRLLLLK